MATATMCLARAVVALLPCRAVGVRSARRAAATAAVRLARAVVALLPCRAVGVRAARRAAAVVAGALVELATTVVALLVGSALPVRLAGQVRGRQITGRGAVPRLLRRARQRATGDDHDGRGQQRNQVLHHDS